MANAAWGIDVGNRALKAVKVERGGAGVVVSDYAFIEHDTILSEAGDNRESLVQTALAKFAGRHDTRKVPVCLGVSGQQSFARFVKLPPVEPKRIPEIVKFEAVQQIPFPLDEVEWSYQIFDRDDDPDVEVGIFAMRKELVNEGVSHFLDVDLDVHAVQTTPLAVYNAARFDGRFDKGHAVVLDLGADSTDLIVADNDGIWMRSLDVGGNAFTEALAKAFKIDFEKAEEMKRNAKTSKYAKQIYQAMRPVFGELVGEIQRSLGFFQSSHRDAKLRKIIALGGGFKLNGLSGYLQKNLQMPVEKPQRLGAGAPDESSAAANLTEHLLSSTAAYGMGLQLLGETKVNSSLLPTHIRDDKMWRDKTKYFVAASGLVVGAAMIAFGSYLFQDGAYGAEEATRQSNQAVLNEANGLDSEFTEVTTSGGEKLATVQNVNSLVDNRGYWGQLVGDLMAALPAPEGELAQALAGELGDPNVVDQPDLDVFERIPANQREYVKLQRLESVYTDELHIAINSPTFLATAKGILEKGDFNDFRGVLAPSAQVMSTPRLNIEKARGYVVRLTLTTPVDRDTAYALFDGDGSRSLPNILSSLPQTDNYRVILAALDSPISSVRESGDYLDTLRDLQDAREAYAAGEEMESDAATGGSTPRPPAGAPGTGGGNRPAGGLSGYDAYSPYGAGGYFGGGGGGGSPYGGGVNPYGGNTGGNTGSGTTVSDEEDPAYIDPVTGENVLDRTVMQVIVVVMLNPTQDVLDQLNGTADETEGEGGETDAEDPFAEMAASN